AGEGERGHRPLRARARAALGRHRGCPLPPSRGPRQPRRAPVRADEVDDRAAEASLRDERVLPQERRRDGGGVRALARGGADDARDRRALRRGDRARAPSAAALSDPRRRGAGGHAEAPGDRGPPPPVRRPPAGRMGKRVPEPARGRNPGFAECLADGEELKRTYDTDAEARRILDVARGLEGIVRNSSIHAAAVVIADRPLAEIVPLQLAEDRAVGAERGANGKPERAYK